MSVQPVQTFEDESRVYDGLSHGVLVVEESRLMAKVEDPIRVLYESPSRGAARPTLGRSVLALVLPPRPVNGPQERLAWGPPGLEPGTSKRKRAKPKRSSS